MKRTFGFSLIEVLVSVLILSFGALALMRLNMINSINSNIAKDRDIATTLARKQLESLTNSDLCNYATGSTTKQVKFDSGAWRTVKAEDWNDNIVVNGTSQTRAVFQVITDLSAITTGDCAPTPVSSANRDKIFTTKRTATVLVNWTPQDSSDGKKQHVALSSTLTSRGKPLPPGGIPAEPSDGSACADSNRWNNSADKLKGTYKKQGNKLYLCWPDTNCPDTNPGSRPPNNNPNWWWEIRSC